MFYLRCEKALMASVNVKNCVKFYTTADEIGAHTLKDHCSSLISTHWVKFVLNKILILLILKSAFLNICNILIIQ